STLKQLEGQITKLVSIYCINWLKDQRNAFQNIFRLLKKGGGAAVCFPLQTSYNDVLLKVQNDPKWSDFLKNIDTMVSESHQKKWNCTPYKEMLEDIGFEIVYCKEEVVSDVISSEEKFRSFFSSVCVLKQHVPKDRREELKNDFIEELSRQNGRHSNGLPLFTSNVLECEGI
ncbi:juvenile hormone acid O-methyltransferase, partial [Trichonephila clavata]